ncbi:hypothetical protein D3C85_930410 [compost metagenome]
MPGVRRPSRRHGRRRGCGDVTAQARQPCGGGRRPGVRRAQRSTGQQRWRPQGRLFCPQRGRAGGRDQPGAGQGRRRAPGGRLHRNPRHRHVTGRPGGIFRPQPGVWRRWASCAVLWPGLGQKQHRSYRHRGRAGRVDQGHSQPGPPADPAEPSSGRTQPAIGPDELAVLPGGPLASLAGTTRPNTLCGGEFLRGGRDQCSCPVWQPGGRSGAHRPSQCRTVSSGVVGQDRRQTPGGGAAIAGLCPQSPSVPGPGRPGLHPASRPQSLASAIGAGGPGPRAPVPVAGTQPGRPRRCRRVPGAGKPPGRRRIRHGGERLRPAPPGPGLGAGWPGRLGRVTRRKPRTPYSPPYLSLHH